MTTPDDLRAPLLALHKAVLAAERTNVERVHGELSGAEYLQIVSDPVRYGWLKPLTELVLALDPHEDDEEIDVVARARELLLPAEAGHAVRPALPVADAARAGARHGPLGAGEAALSSTRPTASRSTPTIRSSAATHRERRTPSPTRRAEGSSACSRDHAGR